MTVYVDDVRHRFGRMVMCHMWAGRIEPGRGYIVALDELFAMADRIGVARRWLQTPPRASWIHFDISLGMKAKAIEAGALLTDKYGPIEHCINLGQRQAVDIGQIRRTRATLGTPENGILRP